MFLAAAHDHDQCRTDALTRAAELCGSRGARFTPLRRRVLELVWRSHVAIGAYDLMGALRGDGKAVTPPTVYRALEFLMSQGLVHRVASLNAYIGCSGPEDRHAAQFLICRHCHQTLEVADRDPGEATARSAGSLGFTVERVSIEVHGLCAACLGAGDA